MEHLDREINTFESLLARDGRLVYKTRGISMKPMLHENRDLVIICVPEGRLRPYDVALYRRGSAYVLHRVIHVRERDYLIRGDNTYHMESVPDSAVIGVLTGFKRKGKEYSVQDPVYRWYVRIWCAIYPVRAIIVFLLWKAKVVARKLGISRKNLKTIYKKL